MDKKPKLLLLGSQMAVAGAQRVLLDQAHWFYEQGWDVTAVFLYDRDGLAAAWQASLPVPLINLNAWSKRGNPLARLPGLLRGLWQLWRLLRSGDFDAVETFTHHANLLGLPLAWLAGVPRRWGTHHGRLEKFHPLLMKTHSWMINHGIASGLVVVSERVFQAALEEGVNPQKIVIIPNGVRLPPLDPAAPARLRAEIGLKAGGNLVVCVGRLTVQKAQTFLLQAAPLVLQQQPHTVFALAGDGPLRAELEAEARQLGIQHQVRFLGVRADPLDWMAAADVFVLPSRSEGMPMVLLEAMGVGAPVVSTNVPGVNELISDGQSGLIVPREDPAALAAAIQRLLSNPEERQQMGRAGREHIWARYRLDLSCQQYARLFSGEAKI